MPGLVPGIHVFPAEGRQDVDARHKAGHDELLYITAKPGGPESLTIQPASQQAMRGSAQELLFRLDSAYTLMVRRRSCAVSNHKARGPSFETRRRRRSSG